MFSSVVRGIFYGIFLVVFVGPVSLSTLMDINMFYFLFNILGANLRHSHIWLSYGWFFFEHIFISPMRVLHVMTISLSTK